MEVSGKTWQLMSRCLSGEASAEEQSELNYYLLENSELQHQFETLKELWHIKQQNHSESKNQGNLNRIFQRAAEERNETTEPIKSSSAGIVRLFVRYGIAATLLIGISLFYFKYGSSTNETSLKCEQVITAQNGSRTRALLPDGSTVWLNAGSKLSFQSNFDGSSRDVILEGEAFFDVVRMPNKPFIVHLGAMNIKVLGTAFNVKNYKKDNLIETTLLRGAIEVIPNNSRMEEHIFLKPNQKLVFSKSDKAKVAPKADLDKVIVQGPIYQLEKVDDHLQENERLETAWVYNRVEFRGESFEELADKLERWYNVDISFEDEAVKQLKFNGSFEKETVSQAFDALKKVASFDYKLNGREIFIRSPK